MQFDFNARLEGLVRERVGFSSWAIASQLRREAALAGVATSKSLKELAAIVRDAQKIAELES